MRRRDLIRTAAAGALAAVVPRQTHTAEALGDEQIPWSRGIPLRYRADVAVIGGGIAGVSAACAAAKSGAKVTLIERFAITGGNLTTGGVASFCGETEGQGEVFEEIVAELSKFHAVAPYKPYEQTEARIFDHHVLAIVLQELLLRRGVRLLLHTRFVDVRLKGGRITECILCGKSGPEALRANVFIDCTGDADVARGAGFAVEKGRPQDGLQLPMSMMFFVRELAKGEAGPQLPEGWFQPIRRAEDLPMTSVWPNGPGGHALKVKIPMFDSTDTGSLTAAEIRARRRIWEVLDYYQRVKGEPWRYDGASPQIGLREGARIVGDYVLTLADLRAGKKFDDAIARGVYYLDGHRPDDDKRTYILSRDEMRVPPYQIPYRCLVAKDGENLLMAGRCFSAEQLALSSARVSTTCSMMGQAAGIAAAECAKRGCAPRQLDGATVRAIVEARGGVLES
ncbi:MAG TPA: FAD-dependent oxidoreductase [Verrucomicrobiae bacterium]|nr:FAD-dependent oxidoreductase [Verrucomicrobiae bacterium]